MEDSENSKALEAMLQKYRNLGVLKGLEEKVIKRKPDIPMLRDDLFLDPVIYDKVYERRPDLLKYLILFAKNSRTVERKYKIRVKYPVVEDLDVAETSIYELELDVFNNFWFHKIYTNEADYEGFERCESIGAGIFNAEVISNRSLIKDSYLSMITDSFFLLDQLVEKNKKKILVVESDVFSTNKFAGSSQLFAMSVKNSTIHVYDKNTTNCQYKVGSNTVVHYSKDYVYDHIQYDICMINSGCYSKFSDQLKNMINNSVFCVYDDAWTSDKRVALSCFKCDKVKVRLRSSPLVPNYQYQELGGCPACIEMKYMMKRKLEEWECDFYLKSHGRNCITSEVRCFQEGVFDPELVRVESIPDIVKKESYVLPWDLEMVANRGVKKIVNLNVVALREKIISVSDFFFVTPIVYELSSLIYNTKANEIMVYGAYARYGIKQYVPRVKLKTGVAKGETLNKSVNLSYQNEKSMEIGISYELRGDVYDVSFRNLIKHYCLQHDIRGIVENVLDDTLVQDTKNFKKRKKYYVSGKAFGDVVAIKDFEDWLTTDHKLKGLKIDVCRVQKIPIENIQGYTVKDEWVKK